MNHELHNLDPESLLLLYLADELSADDRAEVDRQIRANPALRAKLDALAAANGLMETALSSLDASRSLRVSESTAVRSVGRAMAQWQVDRAIRPAVEEAHRKIPVRWVLGIGSIAAVVAIAFFVWRTGLGDLSIMKGPLAMRENTGEADDDTSAIYAGDETPEQTAVAQLNDVEADLYALTVMSESVR